MINLISYKGKFLLEEFTDVTIKEIGKDNIHIEVSYFDGFHKDRRILQNKKNDDIDKLVFLLKMGYGIIISMYIYSNGVTKELEHHYKKYFPREPWVVKAREEYGVEFPSEIELPW